MAARHNSEEDTASYMDVGWRLANVFQGSEVSGHSSIDGVPITLFSIKLFLVRTIGIKIVDHVILEDFGKLVSFRLSAEKRLPAEQFGKDASARPNVDWSGVTGRQQDFR